MQPHSCPGPHRSLVLVTGLPRSGTTWTGRVLGAAGAVYVHEPDNHLVLPEAWSAKRGLGAFPALAPGQNAPTYRRLWELAFAGGVRPSLRYSSARLVHRAVPRSGRGTLAPDSFPGGTAVEGTLRLAGVLADRSRSGHAADAGHGAGDGANAGRGAVMAKSVFAARALEWLADCFDPRMLVVERHPFAVIGSWARLGWEDFLDADAAAVHACLDVFAVSPPSSGAAWIDRAAWHFGFLSGMQRLACDRHPEWCVVRHEDLCSDPPGAFRHLAGRLGLDWNDSAERFLLASNRRGRGYSTNRVWAEEVDGWHTRLAPDDQERVAAILDRFGHRWAPAPGVRHHENLT